MVSERCPLAQQFSSVATGEISRNLLLPAINVPICFTLPQAGRTDHPDYGV